MHLDWQLITCPLFHIRSICDIITHSFWSTLLKIPSKNELGIKTNKKEMPYQHWSGEGGGGVRQQSTLCLMEKMCSMLASLIEKEMYRCE